MGIKTNPVFAKANVGSPLKNLPTTWGLRLLNVVFCTQFCSEKPPHHMGIKTLRVNLMVSDLFTLKNLPTTWGLRP